MLARRALVKKPCKRPAAALVGLAASSSGSAMVISHERSRSQFLVRLGLEGSKTFRYNGEGEMRTVEKHAVQYLRKRCRANGVDVPDKYL